MNSEEASGRDRGGPETAASPRKPYEKPELVVYGDLATITRTIGGTNHPDGSGHPNRHFTS